MPDIKEIDKALLHPAIEIITPENGHFSRWRKFKVGDATYAIKWFCNISYLYIGDVLVPFDRIERSSNWPNEAKTNLQFYNEHRDICCVLPIEYHG